MRFLVLGFGAIGLGLVAGCNTIYYRPAQSQLANVQPHVPAREDGFTHAIGVEGGLGLGINEGEFTSDDFSPCFLCPPQPEPDTIYTVRLNDQVARVAASYQVSYARGRFISMGSFAATYGGYKTQFFRDRRYEYTGYRSQVLAGYRTSFTRRRVFYLAAGASWLQEQGAYERFLHRVPTDLRGFNVDIEYPRSVWQLTGMAGLAVPSFLDGTGDFHFRLWYLQLHGLSMQLAYQRKHWGVMAASDFSSLTLGGAWLFGPGMKRL